MRTLVESILLTLLVAAPGCINADPSNFAVDAGRPTDAVVHVDTIIDDDSGDVMDPNAACRGCLEAPEDPGPGCKTVTDECLADENCSKIYECGFANACWGLPAIVECQLCGYMKCILPLGLSLGSPSVNRATAVVECDYMKCNPKFCGPTQ